METGNNNREQMMGVLLYSAISPDYILRTIIFTDRRVLEIPLSKISEFVGRISQLPSVAAWLVEAANPSMFGGLGSMVGLKMWKNLRKNTEGKQVVFEGNGPLPDQTTSLATSELFYDKIKSAEIKKVPLSSDYYLKLDAGFWHSKNIVFDGRRQMM
ncbi:MAG: hypothetical protein JRN10_04105 [Nitrososphaerota archaeon]|nr:hypothetical protein [Nitrososphaerota archaeon]MDG6930409.1 hypothetical protein [Nitrososphaerota archaeon]